VKSKKFSCVLTIESAFFVGVVRGRLVGGAPPSVEIEVGHCARVGRCAVVGGAAFFDK